MMGQFFVLICLFRKSPCTINIIYTRKLVSLGKKIYLPCFNYRYFLISKYLFFVGILFFHIFTYLCMEFWNNIGFQSNIYFYIY